MDLGRIISHGAECRNKRDSIASLDKDACIIERSEETYRLVIETL